MDVSSLSGLAISASLKTQRDLATDTKRLASGLRVNSAADDPSGLAISQSLATRVQGLDQGVQEIQNAGNALTVAEGAMSSIGSILQRMRALVVEARSDLLSAGDRSDLQSELDQLRLEIDRIAENTSFNGRALLDGSASSAIAQSSRAIMINPALAGGGTLIDTTVDPNSPYIPANAPQFVNLLSVDSYDPVTDNLNITVTIGSQESSFGADQTVSGLQVPNGSNFPSILLPPAPGQPTFLQNSQNGTGPQVLAFNIGTLTPGDVGKEALIISLPAQFKAAGSALQINTGDAEGSVLSVDIPGLSSTNLGVNEVILGNDLQNEAAEYRIDYAITTLGGVRAQVGAQTVSLQEAANSGNVASVNTQAAESAIRDLDVGSAVTTLTRDQIQSQFQTRLVADANKLSKSIATLVADSIVAR
ncbi:MAG TPA: flagellin [Candidatus Elarobacter sp.]|nr:flagellin [Candidatus Elarobacter sp.]